MVHVEDEFDDEEEETKRKESIAGEIKEIKE